jgi:hypothetical protein
MNQADMPASSARTPVTLEKEHVRVHFDLLQDNQGYPPAKSETLWAIPLGPSQFCLDNIPFFVSGVSCFDVVEARMEESGHLKYQRLLKPGGHSTIRVIFYDRETYGPSLPERVQELRNKLHLVGCRSELSHIQGLISVDVPPVTTLADVRSLLEAGTARGEWDYEEATLAESIQ